MLTNTPEPTNGVRQGANLSEQTGPFETVAILVTLTTKSMDPPFGAKTGPHNTCLKMPTTHEKTTSREKTRGMLPQ